MLPRLLRPAYPDAARAIIQMPQLNALVAGHALSGVVLNAGCGEGGYCAWIESQPGVTRIDNIDVSVTPDFSTWHPDPRHHVQVGSLTDLPYADASFNAAVCTEVIEHIPDDRRAVAELARVMKPGGLLIASVPLRPAPFDPAHAHADYSVEEFTALLTAGRFTVEDHRVCFHALIRGLMSYFRAPLITFGANRTPYIPHIALSIIAHADRVLRLGQPWDLVVRARKN